MVVRDHKQGYPSILNINPTTLNPHKYCFNERIQAHPFDRVILNHLF